MAKRVASEAEIVERDGSTSEVDVDVDLAVADFTITVTRGKLTLEITSVLWRDDDCSCRIWRLRLSGSI